MPDANGPKLANFMKKVRADKWNQLIFTLIVSLVIGVIALIIQPSANIGRIFNFLIYFIVSFFIVYIYIAGYAHTVDSILHSILPNTLSKKLASSKTMFGWVCFMYGWFIAGASIVAIFPSVMLLQIWAYSIALTMTVYPCLASLAIYLESYKYLRLENNEVNKKKAFVKSLTIITIGLASPWLLVLFFILAFFPTSLWIEFILSLFVYMSVYFLAIELPYYQSMEAVKGRMVKGLEKLREDLVEKLCVKCDFNERIAVELNIQRVDRDIEVITAKSSHPYSIIKPIAGFVGVSIGASVIADIIVEFVKIGLS
jgi:hypothetical protein